MRSIHERERGPVLLDAGERMQTRTSFACLHASGHSGRIFKGEMDKSRKDCKNIIECFLEARAHTNDPPYLCHRSMQYRFHPLATVGHLLLTRSASLIHASSSSSQFSCTSLHQLRSSFFCVCVCVADATVCVVMCAHTGGSADS